MSARKGSRVASIATILGRQAAAATIKRWDDTAPAWQPLAETQPVGLLDLASHHCRWPVGEGLFCGHRKAHRSYCAAHKAMSLDAGRAAAE